MMRSIRQAEDDGIFPCMMLPLIVLVIVAFVVFVASRPNDFRYVRSVTVNAPASAVFPHVNDFHKWEAWSPWEKVDPATKKTYGGSERGVGATYAWEGNRQVGAGRMTILESRPNEFIQIRIEFLKPMQATNTIEFSFAQSGNQTVLTHSMFGCNAFMGKLMGTFINMDKMIGGQFQKGLDSIKQIVEAA